MILLSHEEKEVNDSAVEALTADQGTYQRAGSLVWIKRDAAAAESQRCTSKPRIELIPPASLRELLTAAALFRRPKLGEDGKTTETASHPPAWCVNAVHARGEWAGLRSLEAIVDYPVLRPDGSVSAEPGYDPDLRLFLNLNAKTVIPDKSSRRAAVAACNKLISLLTDFPFEKSMHMAAWFAALLTPLARFAFRGPAPLFLIDANVRAAGKGLLGNVVSMILCGERFSVTTYTNEEEELRKRITALALAGERLVMFDNVSGAFGNGVLDAALTATNWKDRSLGSNRMIDIPLYMTWFGTGNNVSIDGDTARRVCHIRLESNMERPEDRNGFRYKDLLAHVSKNRKTYLACALTMLRAYVAAGRPDLKLRAWGSFEEWSALVRNCCVWCGLADPGETRMTFQDQADPSTHAMAAFLHRLKEIDQAGVGMTTAELVEKAKSGGDMQLRDIIEMLAGRLDTRKLGNKLRCNRRRVICGLYLAEAGRKDQARRWVARDQANFLRPVSHSSDSAGI